MGTDPLVNSAAPINAPQPRDMREPGADEQRRMADKREAIADEREAIADERETIADRREVAADAREATADARQDRLVAEETGLDARARAAGDSATRIQQRSYEQIDRVQGLLTASQERLGRNTAGLRRSDATRQREQEAIDREACASRTRMDAQGPAPLKALETQADRLREQAAAAAEALATVEDTLAHEHERHHRVQQAATHRHHAAQARIAASALRALTEPPEGDDGTTLLPRQPT
ncbi:hypothetical protein ACFQ7F_41185 [Streptomyces sp. NPDC056486]|uniref:hypothetical protein n=1 Tax=Streptomyces sp. NPDC056486 TaxID=3345835 RepID=UPI0036D012C3